MGGHKYGFKIRVSEKNIYLQDIVIGSDIIEIDLTGQDNRDINEVFKLKINGDTQYNPNRVLKVEVYTPTNGSYRYSFINNPISIWTIIEDDIIMPIIQEELKVTEKETDIISKIVYNIQGGISPGSDLQFEYEILSSSTAIFGTDYIMEKQKGFFYLKAGENKLHLPDITIKADNIIEGEEFIDIKISSPNSQVIFGSNQITKIKIKDLIDKPIVGFNFSGYSMREGDIKTISLGLESKLHNEVEVNIEVNNGSLDPTSPINSTSDSDITPSSGLITLIFQPGEQTKSFEITALDDNIKEDPEVFNIKIVSSSSNVAINSEKSKLDITIHDFEEKVKAKLIGTMAIVTEGQDACVQIWTNIKKRYDYYLPYKIHLDIKPSVNKYDFNQSGALSDGNILIKAKQQSNVLCLKTGDDNIIEEDEYFEISIFAEADHPDVEVPANFQSRYNS